MATRELRVEIVGDSKSLEKALGNVSSASTKTSKSFNIMKGAALGAAGVIGGALVVGLKRGWEEMLEAQKVAAQTEAVLKSTGGQANVTAKDVEALAGSLSKMSGVDDEAIQSGENLLLTFTNIRNEVGKGNNIFDRATGAILDMSVALGQDISSSAIQLGKALNDPIKGITALRRVGVSFTQGQMALIKSLVDSGNTMGAQKLILRELNKEFGGSAKAAGETLPGQINKLKNAFDEASAALIERAIPYIMDFIEAAKGIMDAISPLLPTIKLFAKYLIDNMLAPIRIIAALLRGDWSAAWDAAKAPFLDLIAIAQPAIDFIKDVIPEAFNAAIGAITGLASNAFNAAKDFGAKILSGVQAGIADLVGWVGSKIMAAITAYVNLYATAFTKAAEFGAKILNGVKSGLGEIASWIAGKFMDGIQAYINLYATAFNKAVEFGGKILEGIKNGLASLVGWMFDKWMAAIMAYVNLGVTAYTKAFEFGKKIIGGLMDGVQNLWEKVTGFFGKIPGQILSAIGDVSKLLWETGWRIMNSLWDGLKYVWEKIASWLSGLADIIKSIKGPISKDRLLLYEQGRAIIGGLHEGMKAEWPKVMKTLGRMGPAIQGGTTSWGDLIAQAREAGGIAPGGEFSFGATPGPSDPFGDIRIPSWANRDLYTFTASLAQAAGRLQEFLDAGDIRSNARLLDLLAQNRTRYNWAQFPDWIARILDVMRAEGMSGSDAAKQFGLAMGGIVKKPTWAMVGEAGPEAVVPLSRYRGGMGGKVVVNIGTVVGTPTRAIADAWATEIDSALARKRGRTGALALD